MDQELPSAVAWSFLDNLDDGVIIGKNDGTVLYVNQAAKTLLNLNQELGSLDEIFQLDAANKTGPKWSPGSFGTVLHSENGRVLAIESKPFPGKGEDFIQLLISPDKPVNGNSNSIYVNEIGKEAAEFKDIPELENKLQAIVDQLHLSGWNHVFLYLFNHEFPSDKLITAGFGKEEKDFLTSNMPSVKAWEKLFKGKKYVQYRRGDIYLLPGDEPWLNKYFSTKDETISWKPEDLFCVPLTDNNRQHIGVLGLDQPPKEVQSNPWTLQAVELQARLAAVTIENIQIAQDASTRNREYEFLLEANRSISGILEKESVLTLFCQQMLEATQADQCVIYEWDKVEDRLVILKDSLKLGTDAATVGSLNLDELPSAREILASIDLHTDHTIGSDPYLRQRQPWVDEDKPYTLIFIPIVLSEETYGLVEIIRQGKHRVKQNQSQTLQVLARQASTALENALIFEETYEREQFYNALGRVSLAMNFSLNRETILELISSESLRIFNVDGAYIWQLEGDRFVGGAAAGVGKEEFASLTVLNSDTEALVNKIVQNGTATYINHIDSEKRAQLRLPQRDLIQAVLGVPLEQEGKIIGVLVLVDSTRSNRFQDKDATQASIFGVQAAIALQNARLFEELRRFNEELDLRVAERTQALHEESNRVKILLRISSELASSLDQNRVLNQALHLVNEVVNATDGVILLINQESDELEFRAVLGKQHTPLHLGVPSGLMRDKGLAGWMIENRSAVIVHDTREDSRWIDLPRSRGHRSVVGVPLITNDEVIGVLMLFHWEPAAFTMQQVDLVEAAAIQVANAISNANLYLLIRDQAESLGSMLLTEKIEASKSQSILESIADGVLVTNAENQIILANMAAINLLEIKREHLIGKSIKEFLGLYGHAGESWFTTIDDWAENADLVEAGTFLADEMQIEEKIVSVHLSPVLAGYQFFGTVSIFRDITKEVELDQLKSEFVSTVSHELRTPMTSIKGYADLMLMGAAGNLSGPQSRYLMVIKNNADRLHMLVNDLLDISRIETGKTTLDIRPLNLSKLIEEIVEGHLNGRIQHANKDIVCTINMAPYMPLVKADRARITQVLTNLLDNALNYTP